MKVLFAAAALSGVTAVCAQSLEDLKNDGRNTDNILTYGMGYHQQRYSRLSQIDRKSVRRLVPVWNLSLDNNWGEQAQPIVYNGVMYVTNARHTVAIDVATGKQIWKHTSEWPPNQFPLPHAYMGELLRFNRKEVDLWAKDEAERRRVQKEKRQLKIA